MSDTPPKASAALHHGFSREDVRVIECARPYSNFFAVDEYDLTHKKFDGTQDMRMLRAVFIMADAVTVLPYDPVNDLVLLVEQFRAGPYARGGHSPWLLEAIAGRVDDGETPEATARREALEEANIEIGPLELIGTYYPSPGAVSEYMYSYLAVVDLSSYRAGVGGLDDEAEDIRSCVVSYARLCEAVERGEINNGPLLLSVFWLQREHARLRADATTTG